MARSPVLFALLIIASVVCTSNANWYGKRADKDDFFGLLMQQRLDSLESRDTTAETALATIEQIVQKYRQNRAEAAQLKQGA